MGVFSRGARKKHGRRMSRFLTTSAPAPCPPSCDNRPVTHIRHALALGAAFALALPSAAQTITTIAGNGTHAFSPDGSPAATSSLALALDSASNVVVDPDGNLVFSEGNAARVRRIVKKTGALETAMAWPNAPRVDRTGNLWFCA